MPDKLIIVESPAKVKSIKKIVGADYDIAATVGHIRDLPAKELGVDIEADFAPTYVTLPGKMKVVAALKKAVGKHTIVYLASDPDREGEAIAWHAKELLKLPEARYFRITTNEITREGVLAALAAPRKLNMDLVNAQQARRVLDRLVGYQISPILWRKIRRGLSAGRVQSVTVKLVVVREREIKAFKCEEYWKVDALCAKRAAEPQATPFTAHLIKRDNAKLAIPDQTAADAITAELRAARFTVAEVHRKQTASNPAPPFKTSTMQRKAANALHFSAKKTMTVAQQLYEGVELGAKGSTGLITYMRTDSTNIAESALAQVREYIGREYGANYVPAAARQFRAGKLAQEAHEAIRPTDVTLTPDAVEPHLTGEQFRLYRLVWEQFVASQMAPAAYNATTVFIAAGRYTLTAQGREMLFDGYTRVAGMVKTEMDRQHIPTLAEGEEIDAREIIPSQHFTKPPARYTQATLIKTLEELGIGRPSTYATIISTIQDRQYVSLEENAFHATLLGTMVTERLEQHFKDVMDVNFTARMEASLDDIAEAKKDWVAVLREFYTSFARDLAEAQLAMKSTKGDEAEISDHKCATCGRPMVLKVGRQGPFLGCTGYADLANRCTFTMPLDDNGAVRSNAPRPIEGALYEGRQIFLRRGRFGPYLATEDGLTGRLPKGVEPEAVTAAQAVEIIAGRAASDTPLGTLPDGTTVYAKKGRFGPYIQAVKGTERRNLPLPRGRDITTITLTEVAAIASLPRLLGPHPDDGAPVNLQYGRFGPYLVWGDRSCSIGDRPLDTLALAEAVTMLKEAPERPRRRAARGGKRPRTKPD
ncbi:MAG: type I DNA topoisomerase [Planctomycetota bacterium]